MTNNYDIITDAALMEQSASGDQEAFTEIVRRYQNFLLNYFVYMGANKNIGEDLTQNTFIRLYKYRKRYRPTAGFKTFLLTLARNTRIDWLRKKRRTREKEVELFEASGVRTNSRSRQTEDSIDIREALAQISEKLRDVVVLNVYEGLNYREVAETLGIPEGTVKSRMHMAVMKLREIMDENAE